MSAIRKAMQDEEVIGFYRKNLLHQNDNMGCLAIFIVLEIILYLIFKVLDKKYTPLIERKLEKYFNKFEEKDEFI